MRVWSFCSQKGGVGKTSLSVHLAVHATSCGERVVIIDLDPQENAKAWHTRRGDESTPPMVIPVVPENLGKVLDAAKTLEMTLVIVDTAGKLDATTLTIIRAADLIISPSLPNLFDMDALRASVDLIQKARKLDSAICVINGLFHKGAKQDFLDAQMQAEAIGIRVSPFYCVHRRPYARAIIDGKGVTEFAPKDKASAEIKQLWKYLNDLSPKVKKATSART